MRTRCFAFRLSATTAVAGMLLGQLVPLPAMAQMLPPNVVSPAPADQQAGDPPEQVGRVASTTGTVSFHTQDSNAWSPVSANYPVASGTAFWTEPNASAQLQIAASRLALAGGSELDVGSLDRNGLQATVPQGEVYLHLNNLGQNEAWTVQTPRGLVQLGGPGRYDVIAGDTQNPTMVTVLDGSAQITGPGLALQVGPGQTATVIGTDSFSGSIDPAQQDAFVSAMVQAETPPPAPAVAPPPIVAQMPGGVELSGYGTWSSTPDYGAVWYPRVAADWVPYREGHWAFIPPWGWTWVDDDPWGFAPFHYGRWVEIGGRWGWTPAVVEVAGPPVYAPALVTFFGVGAGIGIGAALAAGSVGWLPLGPREAYHPWYHASDRYLRAVNIHQVNNATVINRNVTINNFANRRAVTVVPSSAMAGSRPVRPVAQRVDPRSIAGAHPMFRVQPIRPTAATAGITPGIARRSAPGPAVNPVRPVPGAAHAALPALRGPSMPRPEGPRPAVQQPGAAGMPALRPPSERQAGPPPINHTTPGAPINHPGNVPNAPPAPAPQVQRPAPQAARPEIARPEMARPSPAAAAHPMPAPNVVHPNPAPPRAAEHVAMPAPNVVHPNPAPPRAAEHVALPAPAPHAAPTPHPAPAPAFHPPPPPHPAPAPHPAPPPAAHPAPAPAPHPAPPPQHEKRPGQP